MTPFLLKHTANYMLENSEMQSVANLDVSNQAGTSGTVDLSEGKKGKDDSQDADDDSLVE